MNCECTLRALVVLQMQHLANKRNSEFKFGILHYSTIKYSEKVSITKKMYLKHRSFVFGQTNTLVTIHNLCIR